MKANRYGTFLTVLLVIIIIAIIVGVGFIVYRNVIKENAEETEKAMAMVNFEKLREGLEDGTYRDADGNIIKIDAPDKVNPGKGNGGTGGTTAAPKKEYYNGYVMIGTIKIPKTGAEYPILEKGTDKALEVSVAVMYPDNAILKLNQPGNVVIMGHNYRNGKFFSNNKKLGTGDIVEITSYTGTRTYSIYEIFETTPNDTGFINRNTNGETEITLSTCTDDGTRRLIILARAI